MKIFCTFLPPANEVWDKVMFLHLSVYRGVGFPACITGNMTWGVCIQGESAFRRGGLSNPPSPSSIYYIWRSSVLIETQNCHRSPVYPNNKLVTIVIFIYWVPFTTTSGFTSIWLQQQADFSAQKSFSAIIAMLRRAPSYYDLLFFKGFDKAQCIKIHFILKLF